MSFLRSHIFAAILSLLVLTGYGYDVFAGCCADPKLEQRQHARADSDKKAPDDSDDCQCLCHQIISPIGGEPVRVAAAILVPVSFTAYADEFPPDSVPVGIDYPPQLA